MSKSDKQNQFYWSKEWRSVRDYYLAKTNYLCELCGKPAKIVHHKIWLDEDNLDDLEISLNEENLQSVCHDCHNKIHFNSKSINEGLIFNDEGQVIKIK